MGKLKWLFGEGVTDLTSYRLGQLQERERIIKLLEGLAYKDHNGEEIICEFKSDLIALIKGETE